jgi:hypothetical protein
VIRKFSKKPYLKRQADIAMIKENKKNFEREQRQRRRWKIKNSFDEKPRLDKWAGFKNKSVPQIETLILSSLGLTDGVQTAVTNIATGLGLRELDFDYVALEDLTTNIYLVKLADVICSKTAANLSSTDRDLVIRAVVGQLFPQPAPVTQAQVRRNGRTEQIIEGIQAVRAQSRRL